MNKVPIHTVSLNSLVMIWIKNKSYLGRINNRFNGKTKVVWEGEQPAKSINLNINVIIVDKIQYYSTWFGYNFPVILIKEKKEQNNA